MLLDDLQTDQFVTLVTKIISLTYIKQKVFLAMQSN